MLVRNSEQCKSINEDHRNNRYLKDYVLLENIVASPDPAEALSGTPQSLLKNQILITIFNKLVS